MKRVLLATATLVSLGFMSTIAQAPSALSGVIDIHAHTDPDSRPRSIDALDLAKMAKARGMRGLVLKNHFEPTAAQAYLVRKDVPGLEVFGGIVLNQTVGGINPAAVEHMVQMKDSFGRVIWLPTFDSENAVRLAKENRPFVSVAKNGRLLPEVLRVIALAAQHGLLLETGHSSAEEALMIVHEAHRQSVQHIVVTHAMKSPVKMTISQMQEAARDGAFIEIDYGGLLGARPEFRIEDYAKAIRQIGPARCILSSDLGQPGNPLHPDGLAAFFDALRKQGFSQAEIDLMSKTNPARVLGLQ